MRLKACLTAVSLLPHTKILNMDVKQLYMLRTYREMFQHPEQHAWIKHMKDLLCCHGFSFIGNDQSVVNEECFWLFLSKG